MHVLIRVKEHFTEVRSSEPGSTSADLSKVEGISLNVASPAHDEPTDGYYLLFSLVLLK